MTSAAQFVHEQNILRFMDLLRSESEPARRATLGRLLIEEEGRYGTLAERIDTANLHIADSRQRIESQEARIGRLQSVDGGAISEARRLLGNLNDVQSLLEAYRQRLQGEWDAQG